MKNYSAKISEEAKEDIAKALDYIAIELCAPMAALNLNAKITEEIKLLKAFPFSGTLVDNEEGTSVAVRWVRVENYMIFYTVNEAEESVYILRILYGSSNYQNML